MQYTIPANKYLFAKFPGYTGMYVAMYTNLVALFLYTLSVRAAPTIERKDTKGSFLVYGYHSSSLFEF